MINGESHYFLGRRYRLRVHELVHLLERHHNERFTALMDGLLPSWRVRRRELNASPLGMTTGRIDWRAHAVKAGGVDATR